MKSGTCALGSSFITRRVSAAASGRPNIIFVLTDDQRWDTLGCAGNPYIKTPFIDKLAGSGVRFTNAFVSSPACAPNRACLFTGLYERTHSFTFGSPPLKKTYSDICYPRLLKQAGYRTGYVGKSHVRFEKDVISQLFDSFVPLGRRPYLREVNGRKRHLTEIMTDRAIDFIDSCAKDQPFCLSLSFHAPHAEDDDPEQFYWPESCDGMYDDVTFPPPENADVFKSMPGFLKTCFNRMRWWQRFCTPEKYQQMIRGYYRMITGIDREIGRLVNELESQGLASNTVIIFMGDNGYFLGERGFGGKFMMYEQSLRVPLIVYDPRLPSPKRGKTDDSMTLNIDIAPTILDYAGVAVPERMHGESMKPLVEGIRSQWRTGFLCEYVSDAFPAIVKSEGYRTERWKYIRWPGYSPETEELYDLSTDPMEENNLAGKQNHTINLRDIRKQCNMDIAQYESDRY